MKNLIWLVKVEMLTKTGTQPFRATKAFQDPTAASNYAKSINENPEYIKLNVFAFEEVAIFVPSED